MRSTFVAFAVAVIVGEIRAATPDGGVRWRSGLARLLIIHGAGGPGDGEAGAMLRVEQARGGQ